MPTEEEVRAALLRMARQRGPAKTFCPSEVARALEPEDWRPLMPAIRTVAAALAASGALCCTQRGEPADPATVHGPIRLSVPE